MIGEKLGPYEITAKLGEGGMGEVYRATDSKLKREVAIKVLPAAFTADAERLARFEREAQLLAQLQHPNIASIYGLEESGGALALVMELVEGPTLAERLETGPLILGDALAIAVKVAQALEAAHEKGIVHRDLKPQNIKAAVDGSVKVLDFGLAKALDPAGAVSGPASQLAKSPTLTMGATQLGVILGTAAYMSPEQAKGMPLDKRADVWSFGVVLYEMLVGGSLFAGDSVGDTLAAVIRAEIDLSRLPSGTPVAVRRLLRLCLERNPQNRLHDIADARIALEEVQSGKLEEFVSSAGPTNSPSAALRSPQWFAAAGVAIGLLLGLTATKLGWGAREGTPAGVGLAQFEIAAPPKASYLSGLALSPDGRKIAFAARGEDGRASLWVRSMEAIESRKLPETGDARLPFWAPDSRRIGFFSQRSLKWIDSEGGSPMIVTQTAAVQDVRGAAWGADDIILFAPTFSGPLLQVSVGGGAVAPATRLPEGTGIFTNRFPSFLPDGRRFVYYASLGSGTEPGTLYLGRVGSLDAKVLGPAHSSASFAAPGYLLFARGESLVAQRFDDRKEELTGEMTALGVSMGGSLSVSGLRSLAVSQRGALIFRSDRRGTSQLAWFDRAGHELEAISDGESAWHFAPRLSPDGKLLAVARYTAGRGLGEVWIHDLARKLASRATLNEGDNSIAAWAGKDSRELIFLSIRPSSPGTLYRMSLDRPGEERPWLTHETYQAPNVSTPDGRRMLFERTDVEGKTSLWIRDLDGEGEATPLARSASSELSGSISPDGRWLAYVSDSTRSWEVYVRRLDGAGAVIRVSADGGSEPLWRRDGRELFFIDSAGRLVAVPFSAGENPQPGMPVPLFLPRLEESNDRQYDASADGKRFVLNRSLDSEGNPIAVVLDWTALLERKRQ